MIVIRVLAVSGVMAIFYGRNLTFREPARPGAKNRTRENKV